MRKKIIFVAGLCLCITGCGKVQELLPTKEAVVETEAEYESYFKQASSDEEARVAYMENYYQIMLDGNHLSLPISHSNLLEAGFEQVDDYEVSLKAGSYTDVRYMCSNGATFTVTYYCDSATEEDVPLENLIGIALRWNKDEQVIDMPLTLVNGLTTESTQEEVEKILINRAEDSEGVTYYNYDDGGFGHGMSIRFVNDKIVQVVVENSDLGANEVDPSTPIFSDEYYNINVSGVNISIPTTLSDLYGQGFDVSAGADVVVDKGTQSNIVVENEVGNKLEVTLEPMDLEVESVGSEDCAVTQIAVNDELGGYDGVIFFDGLNMNSDLNKVEELLPNKQSYRDGYYYWLYAGTEKNQGIKVYEEDGVIKSITVTSREGYPEIEEPEEDLYMEIEPEYLEDLELEHDHGHEHDQEE